MNNNITVWLDEAAEKFPDKRAYADKDKALNFSEMRSEAIRIAARLVSYSWFKKPVAVFMEKGVDALVSMFGIAYI